MQHEHHTDLFTPLAALVAVVGMAAVCPASVGPLPEGAEVGWSHAPYEMGECAICHTGGDPADPGPITGAVNELCFGCHDDTRATMAAARFTHYPAEDDCTSCHNPHNAPHVKLLVDRPPGLCADCHSDVWDEVEGAPVRHDAVEQGESCLNCHSPHAANVAPLLNGLPFDLCVGCHARREITDQGGTVLTDFGELLEANPVQHGPVAARDCSACHLPHAGANFRMLVDQYPARFYAPYDPANYALCYSCHNDKVVSEPETTTLTGFRDGAVNLHYVHVNKKKGRTCRACHEVHAATHDHLVRDGVPFGSGGWVLKVNYRSEPDGGLCEKTCHGAKGYSRGTLGAPPSESEP
jgi:predicted CXXCH cytochrome family protein